MAGTDHARDEGWQGQQPAFVLVRPQLGENIGAAARAMWNFGLDRMRLVAPRDGWPNPAAVATASGAAQVLDNLQVRDDLPAALADCTYVFATTARPRGLTKPVVTPERAMQQARALAGEGQKVAILFGPERAGLENADVMRANAIVSVPVNPAFGSLNLAQCVLLMAYEWRRAGEAVPPEVLEMAGARRASQIEVEKLYERLHASLDQRGFFWPDHKAESMAISLRNLFSRMEMTDADIRTWHGVIRTLAGRNNDPN
ncbi:MAG: RNA methyltransferase [Rhodobacteraceae bacterium]|nr:RNA methyltransferase [Paracoccaceae bacterium]